MSFRFSDPADAAPLGRGAAARSPDRRRARRRGGRYRDADRAADRVAERCRCVETVVAHAFGVALADLRHETRGHAPVAFARQVAMYVVHVWFGCSLSAVGRCFGRDRTTVAHACRVVEDRREDRRVDRLISAIEVASGLYEGLSDGLEGER